jgi:hypothetical protein
MKITSRRWWLASIAAAAVAVSAVLATVASAGAGATSSKPGGRASHRACCRGIT